MSSQLTENKDNYFAYQHTDLDRATKSAFESIDFAKEAVKAVLEYAFQELGLSRIVAVIDQNNSASLHVAESCGMLWEKDIVKTDAAKCTGRTCGVYSLTPETYG